MKFLSDKTIDIIESTLNVYFDKIALQILGLVPRGRLNKKDLRVTRNSVASIFLQALGSREANQEETEALKMILRMTDSFLDGVKNRAKARAIQAVNASIAEGKEDEESIQERINAVLDKANKEIEFISNSESNHARNIGSALKIQKVASSQGVERPVVFYNVTYDDRTAEQPEKNIHLISGTKTPRLWYLDEMSLDYWKKGMEVPSLTSPHPNCRCVLTYLPPGFGFDENNKLTYKGEEHDELEYQRKYLIK